jgi:ribosomal protein L40E
MTPLEPEPELRDLRLYVPQPEGWEAKIKLDWEKTYCYAKNPVEDHFHLILGGEIFLQRADEKLCLRCAARRGIITTDRLYWQHQSRRPRPPPL